MCGGTPRRRSNATLSLRPARALSMGHRSARRHAPRGIRCLAPRASLQAPHQSRPPQSASGGARVCRCRSAFSRVCRGRAAEHRPETQSRRAPPGTCRAAARPRSRPVRPGNLAALPPPIPRRRACRRCGPRRRTRGGRLAPAPHRGPRPTGRKRALSPSSLRSGAEHRSRGPRQPAPRCPGAAGGRGRP